MDARQISIERQCATNRATELCCAGKIELNQIEEYTDKIYNIIGKVTRPGKVELKDVLDDLPKADHEILYGDPGNEAEQEETKEKKLASDGQKSFVKDLVERHEKDAEKREKILNRIEIMSSGEAGNIINKYNPII